MKKEARFAHGEGITDITLTPDGQKIITCGSDSDIRVFEDYNDTDPVQFSATDSCFGIVSHSDKVIVATESNTVELLELPKGKALGHKLKFTGAVNHVDISKDGKVLVAGSADKNIQIVQMDNSISTPPITIEGAHSGPVLSIAIDPLNAFIASSGCDGNICVWSFQDPKKLVKKWSNVYAHSNDITTSCTLCRMAWNPTMGNHLAVPIKDKIVIYKRESWEEVQALSCPKLTKYFSVIRYSGCASYIAAGGTDGTIAVWDGNTFSLLASIKDSNHITGLTFNSKSDQLYCTDIAGRMICIQEFTTSSSSSDVTSSTTGVTKTKSTDKSDGRDSPSNEDDVFDDGMDNLFDDDDGDNVFSISKIKADVGFVGDEFVGVSKAKSVLAGGGHALPGEDKDDDDDVRSVSSITSSKLSKPQGPPPTVIENPFTVQQKPFQPSSTPDYLTHRFMAWNNVGIIRSDVSEDEEFNEDSIEIEFHDRGFHNPILMTNQCDYAIGNVSTEVVALACPRNSEHPSKLLCVNFSTWDSNKEWTVDMPDKEEIVGIALGTGWLAAGTSEDRIRLFSTGGVQKYIYDIPGALVAISAFENLLFITYHHSVGIHGNQSIYYGVLKINVNGSKISPLLMDVPLPLSRRSTVTWVGFTDEGTPTYSDSKNIVRLLNGRLWSPVSHMKAGGPNDNFWVVGVSETSNQIRAVRCLGSQFPSTVPKPNVMVLDIKIPLCEVDTEKSKLEDTMLQSLSVATIAKKMEKKGYDVEEYKEKAEAACKTKLFELFALSCKAGRDFRATEYVSMMPTSHAMQVAIKYASKLNRHALIERLQGIGSRKFREEEANIEDEVDDFESNTIMTHVEHRQQISSTTESGYENGCGSSSSSSSASFGRSNGTHIPIIIEDNPLMQKQKDEIRSIISKVPLRRNPFKTGGSTESQNSLSDDSLNTTSPANGFSSASSSSSTSKGMSKIEAWKKPVDKPATLPTFKAKEKPAKRLKPVDKSATLPAFKGKEKPAKRLKRQ